MPPRRASGCGLLPPVHRLLKPAPYGRESSDDRCRCVSPPRRDMSCGRRRCRLRSHRCRRRQRLCRLARQPVPWPRFLLAAAPHWRRRRYLPRPACASVAQRQPRDGHGPGLRNRHWLTPSSPGRTSPRAVFSRSSRSVRKAHYYQGQAMQREMTVGVGAGCGSPWPEISRSVGLARRGAYYAQGGLAQFGTTGWGLAQDAVRPGCNVRELLCKEKGEERRRPSGHAVSQRAVGNRVAMVSVRPVAAVGEPERIESAAWLLPFDSYAAVGMGKLELLVNSNPSVGRQRSRSAAPPGSPISKGKPGMP